MITEKASIEDVVHAALRRAAGHVNEETLLEVQTLLNELGRDPEGARHIRAAVTEDIIARVFTKGARS